MLSRSVLDALLPEGPFWEPEAESDYDKLLDGIAENSFFGFSIIKLTE